MGQRKPKERNTRKGTGNNVNTQKPICYTFRNPIDTLNWKPEYVLREPIREKREKYIYIFI